MYTIIFYSCFLICVVLFLLGFYLLGLKFFNAYYFKCLWSNSIELQLIVDGILKKATIISIIENKGKELTEEEKYKAIIEKASSISADVMLQHNISPKEYNLEALIKVEIFRLANDSKNKEGKNGKA